MFVSETKDAVYSPIDYQYWRDYFSSDNITCHVFQGAIDYCDQYNISANDVKEVLLDGDPKISTPESIDHSAMRQFFCWLPEKRILNTFKYTS